jgi:hypothetical protein
MNDTDSFSILLAKKKGDEYIIMCHLPKNQVTPWATWRTLSLDGSQPRFCGTYHFSQADAELEFQRR